MHPVYVYNCPQHIYNIQTLNWLKPTFFTLVRLLLALKSAVRDVVEPEMTKVATDNEVGHQT